MRRREDVQRLAERLGVVRRDRHRRDQRDAVVGVDPDLADQVLVGPERLVEDAEAELLERPGRVPDLDARRPGRRRDRRTSGRSSRPRRSPARRRGGTRRGRCRPAARTGAPAGRPRAQRERGPPAPRGAPGRSSSSMKRRLPVRAAVCEVARTILGPGRAEPPDGEPQARQQGAHQRAGGTSRVAAGPHGCDGTDRRPDPGGGATLSAHTGPSRRRATRPMQIHAIVLAGGDGNRFGGELPKQFVRLAGDPILLRTLRRLARRADRPPGGRGPSALARRDARADRRRRRLGVDVHVVAGRGDPQREHAQRPRRPSAAPTTTWSSSTTPSGRCCPLEVIQRAIEPIISGRADATDTVIPSADTLVIVDGDDGGRDPGPGPLPARPDAADVPGGRAAARLRRRRAGRRPGRDRRLQPRAPVRPRGADAGRRWATRST